MKTIYLLMAATLFIVANALSIGAQSAGAAYANGKAAQLTATQISNLSALNAAVAIPTYLPTGYKLKRVEIPQPPATGVIDYNLIYESGGGKTFTIQSTNDGIGDVIVKEELSGRNPYFSGKFYAGRDEEDGKTVAVQWIESQQKYQPKSQKTKQYYSLTTGENGISPAVAVKIMKSLRYLKR